MQMNQNMEFETETQASGITRGRQAEQNAVIVFASATITLCWKKCVFYGWILPLGLGPRLGFWIPEERGQEEGVGV